MKKSVIYARYSCSSQSEQSIEGQLHICNDYAQKNDIVILDTYIERAKTATNDNRPSFQQMLKDSARKQWDYVLVYKNDRFARNIYDSVIDQKKLADNGVTLLSATEVIPDTPEGSIIRALYLGIDEYYSRDLSRKTKRGINESIIKRQFIGGPYLYGYDIIDKKYVINESEAKIIKYIFTQYSNNILVREIVEELNSKGILNKQKKPFAKNSVYRLLRNQKYNGVAVYNGEVITDMIPPIIDDELFNRVQQLIECNIRAPRKAKDNTRYLLAGKIFCGECGVLMTSEAGTSKNGNAYYYYKCVNNKKNKTCHFPSIKKEYIENKVIDTCCSLLKGDIIDSIADIAYKAYALTANENYMLINMTKELEEKKKALSNIVKAIEQGIFTNTTKTRIEVLEKEIETLQANIDYETAKTTKLTKQDFLDFLLYFVDKKSSTDNFKQELINLFIKDIVVYDDKIKISLNYYPNDTAKTEDYIDIDFDIKKSEHIECSDRLQMAES